VPGEISQTGHYILKLRREGKTHGEIAKLLNAAGEVTTRGKTWGANNVADAYSRVLKLLPPSEPVPPPRIIPLDPLILERARELRAEGLTYTATAAALNEEGHRTKTGRLWTYGVVRDALRNPDY
jgi:hypothetical protein